MRRYAQGGTIDAERGRAALVDLSHLPPRRYPHGFPLPRVRELRGNFSAYDALYVSLAEALGASLMTSDRRLAAAAARFTDIDLVAVDMH